MLRANMQWEGTGGNEVAQSLRGGRRLDELPRPETRCGEKMLSAVALSALIAGALPPGYEDEAWCPPDHCIRATPQEPGFVGPQSTFFECAHVKTGEAAAAFWTGARVNAVPLPGWVKVKSALDESFQSVECDTPTAAVTGGNILLSGALGPAWTRGEIEAPQGEKSMGSWTAAVYTSEQQARMGVDEEGQPTPTPGFATPRAQNPRSNDNPPSLWQRVQAKVLGLFRLR